ncbi:MAG: ATP:cob(I)alamin adenosyltransferase [Spirochaetes bacterium GWB1_48_6]|nr:MAG: ATP:cob(I)alamin adenosyltransferase [Spirochaetes bacterium GWB1_48_6]
MVIVTTKTGDKGTTGLFTGEREKKSHRVFECLGTLDELVSHLGVLRVQSGSDKVEFLQKDIFKLNTVLASHPESSDYPQDLILGWNIPGLIEKLESSQRILMEVSPPPERFIIPGEAGSLPGAYGDVARTVCRRAERQVVAYRDESGRRDLEPVIIYLNRASDYLFVLARFLEAAK